MVIVTLEDKKLEQAIIFGAQLIQKAGIGHYKIKTHNRRRALADCNSYFKVIRYSNHFIKVATKEQFEGVTLHEIAHALVGGMHGHDMTFKAKCRELGADENYIGCRAKGVILPPRYVLTCPDCGATSRSNVKKNYICSECKNEGKSVNFLFEENILQPVLW